MATILIASGDAAPAAALAAELGAEGYSVAETWNGHAAYLEALSAPPDLLILDAALDVFDGLAVSEMLRADPEFPEGVPIVLLHGAAPDPRAVTRAGVTATLSKTHGAGEVRELVSALLRDRPVA